MPWEKSFDTDEALEAAMNVFWAKGYEETSMSDLISVMGINKGSLYNAYGSKKTLFIAALKKYDHEHRRQVLKQLEQMDDPAEAISTLFDGLIQESLKDTEHKGCLLVNTSLKLTHHDDDVQRIVRNGLNEFGQFFEHCLDTIKKQNKNTAIANSKETAKILMTLVVGLRVLARGVFNEAGLRLIKRQAMQIIS